MRRTFAPLGKYNMLLHGIAVLVAAWTLYGLLYHVLSSPPIDIHHLEQKIVYYFLLGPGVWAFKAFVVSILLFVIIVHYVENWEVSIQFRNWLHKQ